MKVAKRGDIFEHYLYHKEIYFHDIQLRISDSRENESMFSFGFDTFL